MAKFQERINQLWEEAKDADYRITQEEFADKIKATKNQLKGWLRGSGEPDSEAMKTIARNCDVSVDWLVGNSNVRAQIDTIAAHRTDNPIDDLPEEARKSIEEFKAYIRSKYCKKPTTR